MMFANPCCPRFRGATVAIAAFVSTISVVGAGCLRAEAPGAVVLPDGSTYAAETVRLCRVQALSPVADLYEARIDDASVGIFIGRRQAPESPQQPDPALFFYRTGPTEYELFGWVETVGGVTESYSLETIGKIKKRVVTRELFSDDRHQAKERPVVLAAALAD